MSTQTSGRNAKGSLVVPVIGLVIGIVLTVVAQFFLDSLVDSNGTWHGIKHSVLFLGGLVVGVAGFWLWASGRRA